MAKKKKGIFEADRRMELRMRLAAKKATQFAYAGPKENLPIEIPELELLNRIIDRVRHL
ncbi:MAG: hypothetical protein MUO58_11715 [Anaerolineales bacterium]|nr:hypothetical protein [Anaerolineales bacterium]